ncbi:MAG: putative transcription regulator [bacterium P3]|nr:MAG: putative transcription regulator [bacterium P3]KWW41859.1 MAG: putative transcription regulator [bacterium F083]
MSEKGNKKTNAARMLDQMKISYGLVPYEVDENDLGAAHIARQLGQPIERLFKTLVLRGDRTGLFVCVIPGAEEVDLKKAAKVTGNKKVEMIHVKELLPLTGYIRGGCSPIGMKKPLPTWFHETVMNHDTVYCSAGQRGLQFRLAPADLLRAAKGRLADLTV